ncbi:MAG: 3-deoxy-7-phosphoheptulonate synthase, partial [Bacteroidota bacterium]
YHRILDRITDAIHFMEVILRTHIDDLDTVEFYTSHEGLHLHYEEAQTRQVPRRTGWYNLSTHFPWIGDRTRQLDGAHIEFFRGIANPIGVKVGPTMKTDELIELAHVLNPANEPGRLTLIHRFGARHIDAHLPRLIAAVERERLNVVWCCDPMHGNTERTDNGFKTRRLENILEEVDRAFTLHSRAGTWLGGVHVELTGEDVTECIGGARGLDEAGLERAYRSHVDPRLNYEQSLELALFIADRVGR